MKISLLNKSLYLLLSLSLFIGFYFGEDSSGSGGHIADFNNTWQLVLNFQKSLFIDFTKWIAIFPLHYIILSKIQTLVQDQYLLRLFHCTISLIIPYLFYVCLKNKFENVDKNLLFLFSLIIFLLPSFRSGAIWANSQITGLIFFLLSLVFFTSWIKKKDFNRINLDLFLQVAFMSLAVYTRQLYAAVFLYFVFLYYKNLKFKTFLLSCTIIFIFALPGIFLVLNFPILLGLTYDGRFYNSILVNSSIISFYLIPIYFSLFFAKQNSFHLKDKKIIIAASISVFIVSIFSYYFNYDFRLGGGFFLKLSIILFDNFYLFFASSLIGLFLISLLSFENKDNFILLALLILTFSGFYIAQKYFEPIFLLLLFVVLETKISHKFFSNFKHTYFYYSYILIYFVSAVINDVFKITKSI
tara:strand:- start:3757 stop:4995 length:1239 start_codon:yes stop_codon:yes gene_type:complete